MVAGPFTLGQKIGRESPGGSLAEALQWDRRVRAQRCCRGDAVATEPGSVSGWIGQLQAGDSSAAQQLWERYFEQLVELAGKKLQGATRRVVDEEDVALSALASFFRGALEGRFPQLRDRTDLWRLLVVLTARKAFHVRRYEQQQKRGSRQLSWGGSEPNLEQIVGREPTPEFAAQVAEECRRLLARLDSEELRSIARWKMEGYTTEEIAAQLGCAPSTVERRLRLIRRLWEQESKA
jgi:DNA-directed RNA polymerase specialized sigma24 family protein